MSKILIISTYSGLINRGAETFSVELTKNLNKLHNVVLVSQGEVKEISNAQLLITYSKPAWLKFYGILFKYLQSLTFKFKSVFFYPIKLIFNIIIKIVENLYIAPGDLFEYYYSKKVFLEVVKNDNFDLIIPANGYWGCYFSDKHRKTTGTKFIYIGHGGIGITEKKVLRIKPDLFCAISTEQYIWARVLFDKVKYIPNGVDFNRFNLPNSDFVLPLEFTSLERPIILCVGAFSPYKRHNLLIDAIQKLGFGTLILMGDGELKNEVLNYAETKIKGRYIHKYVSQNEIPNYYQFCDIFTLPSLNEAFGIVFIEAMSANKPVVAPNNRVMAEIIGDAGILCNVEDFNDYAEALKVCLNRKWGNIPSEHVKSNFTWEYIITRYNEAIEAVLMD